MDRTIQELANKADQLLDQLVQTNMEILNLLEIDPQMSKSQLIEIALRYLQPEGLTMLREYVYKLALAHEDAVLRENFRVTAEANLRQQQAKRSKR